MHYFKNTSTKNRILILGIVISILVLFTILLFYPLLNFKKTVTGEYDSSTKLTNNGQKIEGGFDGYSKIFNKNEIVITNSNPLNPTFSVVFNFKSNEKTSDVDILHFKRKGLFKLELDNYRSANIKNKSFQEAIAIAQKYDLSNTNPDPKNITVYPAPTPEQIQNIKKSQEITNNPEYQAQKDKCREDARPTLDEEKARLCIEALDKKFGKD